MGFSDLRAMWRKAKKDAQRVNNGAAVDVEVNGQSLDLGPTLDEWARAADVLDNAPPGEQRDQARQAFLTVDDRARRALFFYEAQLRTNVRLMREVNSKAREELVDTITRMNIEMANERTRLGVRDYDPPPEQRGQSSGRGPDPDDGPGSVDDRGPDEGDDRGGPGPGEGGEGLGSVGEGGIPEDLTR